jgi:hypothetical protein
VNVLSGTSPIVRVTVSSPDAVSAVSVMVGDTTYVLSQSGPGTYDGMITAPGADEVLNVIVSRKAGGTQIEPIALNAQSSGIVLETLEDGREVPVENVIVTAYRIDSGARILFDAQQYGEANPERSTARGTFGWYAPNGQYSLVAERDGYESVTASIFVGNTILGGQIMLRRMAEIPAPPIVPPIAPVVPAVVSAILPVGAVQAITAVSAVASVAVQAVADVLASPEAQATATVTGPVNAAVTVSSTIILASSFNLGAYLQYLITSPLLLFSRRKRKNFGVVYNAMTKIPIELAIVRLYRVTDNRLIKSVVTNAEGKYFLFVPEAGEYIIKVVKNGFNFPSAYLANVKDDGTFLDVYTTQAIRVTSKDATIAANIPLDPSSKAQFQGENRLRFKRFFRVFQRIVSPLGVLLSLFVVLTLPSVFSVVMFIVQIFSLFISIRLAWPKKPKGWGLVTESATRSQLGNVVVRLFEPRYNKLVESTLTDSRGRYSFLLGANEYYVATSNLALRRKSFAQLITEIRRSPRR